MLRIKGCPRCNGTLSRVEDLGVSYLSCVQCGFVTYRDPQPSEVRAA